MGIFSSIKDAILGKDRDADRREPADVPPHQPASTAPAMEREAASRSHEVDVFDVENRLDSMPGADRLNWRTSIVDLMKLIGVDSSLESRKALARELGYDGPLDGSAEMNIWLHRKTMQELSRNGGKVPAEFLD